MFKLTDNRTEFYQWDLNRTMIIEDNSISQVHFENNSISKSLVCEVYEIDGIRVVNVPNVLLQQNLTLNVYACDGEYTLFKEQFKVNSRPRPEGYVYTETETLTWERVDKKAQTAIEEAKAAKEQAAKAMKTAEEALEVAKNSGGGGETVVVVQADYLQNDAEQPDHILNRPFYQDGDKIYPIEEKFIPDSIARAAIIGEISEALDAILALDEELMTPNGDEVKY